MPWPRPGCLPVRPGRCLAGEGAQGSDVGEIRRVLNSFLQFLEQDPSDNPMVGASNHPQLLDRALYRRFESVIEYPLPSPAVGELVIRNRLATIPTAGIDWKAVRDASRSHSHAELTMAAEAAILTNSKVTTGGLVDALSDRRMDMDQ